MSSPLLLKRNSKKVQPMTIEEAVAFLKKHFKSKGYASRSEFCQQNKVKYSTLNAILNWNPTSNVKLPIKKIPVIFAAIGFNCEINKVTTFDISPIE